MSFVVDKSKLTRGLQYRKLLHYLAVVQYDMSDLAFAQIMDYQY